MDKLFEASFFTRDAACKILKSMTRDQILRIPDNFNNSLFWNVAHLMVTEQLLSYKLSGLPLRIEKRFVERYGKGSTCTEEVPVDDIDYVVENLIPLHRKVQEDYRAGVFSEYQPYKTSTGIELKNIEEALQFSAYHDGIHLGVILSLKKIV